MRVILVLGKKLSASGKMSEEFKQQVENAIRLFLSGEADLIVFSGGVTRAGFCAEAEAAASMVPRELDGYFECETASKTTLENVVWSRELLKDFLITKLIVVTSRAHELRAKFLIRRFWPEVYPCTVYSGVAASPWQWIQNLVRYIPMRLYPDGRFFEPLVKRLFRNG